MQFKRNHPCLKKIQIILKKYDSIKYAAYRTSSKLRSVQTVLLMDRVSLQVISGVFEKHQLPETENSVKLDPNEMESVLSDIYFATQRENHIEVEKDMICQLMIALLLNIYDKEMKNLIPVLSCKIFLALICQAKPREKYHYLFHQLADHNNCLSKKRLQILLTNLVSVIEYIGEEISFGADLIAGTVESCFKVNNGTLGISEDDFISWLTQDPQLLVWVSTFYRMQISESVMHNAKCEICKINPIVGLRYRCLRCLSYDMCQTCFFHGKLNKKHKLKHPVQEFCHPMTTQQSTKTFLLTLKNILYKKNSKLQYLPALRVDSIEFDTWDQSTSLTENLETHSKIIINGSHSSFNRLPFQELQSIISHLEMESEKLIPQVENLCTNLRSPNMNSSLAQVQKCLLNHKYQIEDQVRRLKLLKNYLAKSRKNPEINNLAASTPVVHGMLPKTKNKLFDKELECLSPIKVIRASDSTATTTTTTITTLKDQGSNKKLMWDNYDFENSDLEASWKKVRGGEVYHFLDALPGGDGESQSLVNETANENDDGENEICLSTYLGRRTLHESEDRSRSGLTWLREERDGEHKENERPEEESQFEELRLDLQKVLGKLQDASIGLTSEESTNDNNCNKTDKKIEMAEKVDSLLLDLIKGIEKLMGT